MRSLLTKLTKVFIGLAAAILIAILLPTQPAHAFGTDSYIFINEFNYAYTASNPGDFVELLGPARMNVNNWTLEVYNSSGVKIETRTLSGTFGDQFGGFGTLVFEFSDLPDTRAALALRKNDGTVVQFVSYGGAITAQIGGASYTSTNIYTGTKPLDFSLALRGGGDSYNDFSWSGWHSTTPIMPSKGNINNYQIAGATVFINEFSPFDHPSYAANYYEFIEVMGPSTSNLTGWKVDIFNADGTLFGSVPLANFSGGGPTPDSRVTYGLGFTYHMWPPNADDSIPNYGALALIDPDGYAWQFFSWRGAAVTGAAGTSVAGLTSTILPVSLNYWETYDSWQLADEGRILSDFYWGTFGEAPNEGKINKNQRFLPSGWIDSGPVVEAVTPVNGASEVPVNSTITIDFNDPVETSPGWVNVSCQYGGTRAVNISSQTSAGVFTLTPTLPFERADVCTVTITASKVLDQDGSGNTAVFPRDPMPWDYVWTFTTLNTQPVANPQSVSTPEDTAINITLTGSDGPENRPGMTYSVVTNPTKGTLSGTAPDLVYTPAQDYFGQDSFTFVVYDSLNKASAPATVSINVVPVNDPPQFNVTTVGTILEDIPLRTVANFVTDMNVGNAYEAPVQTYSFTVDTSNNAAFEILPAIDNNGTLTYKIAQNFNGTVVFYVTMTDSGPNGGSDVNFTTKTATLTVTPVNDAPSFVPGDTVTVNEDSGDYSSTTPWVQSYSTGPADESGQTVSYIVTADEPALFSSGPAIDADGFLTFTPAPDQYAPLGTTVRVTIQDDGGTANGGVDKGLEQSFTIIINPVNDAPSFVVGPNQTVYEDAQSQTVSPWATSISKGAYNETAQHVSFEITANTNPSIFSTLPSVSPEGVLTYAVAPNMSGTSTITLRIKDDGGTLNGGVDTSETQSFTITVLPVNDAPSFNLDPSGKITSLEDQGLVTRANWATDIYAGAPDETGQALTFYASIPPAGHAFFTTLPSIDANGTLTYELKPDFYGGGTVSVYLKDDGGTANGGVDTSAIKTFTIEVLPVNDVPYFTVGSDITVDEDSTAYSQAGWTTGNAGAENEADQKLTFVIESISNPDLFTGTPKISVSPEGTLNFTVAPDMHGTATVSIYLKDDGGTANGGVDTSASQTFTITVNAVNDPPSFTKGEDHATMEDSGPQTVEGWATNISAGAANESDQVLTFNILSNDYPELFSAGPAVDPLTGNLTYTPAPNMNGTAYITLNLTDDQPVNNTSVTKSFTIYVAPVNDPPTFTAGDPVTSAEDAGAQSFANWIKAYSVGPDDEAATQTISYIVTNDNNALFSVQPAVSSSGTLTYTSAPNAFGTATMTIRAKDSGGGADTSEPQTVLITVTPVNDAPSFVKGNNLTYLEDAPAASLPNWATSILPGPANESAQTVEFVVSTNNSSLFSAGPAISPIGTLTFTLAPNANGTAIVSAYLVDNGGTANAGDVDTSPTQTFTISVTPVNDPPTFGVAGNQTVAEDSPAQTVTDFITNPSTGPADEAEQTYTFQVTNDKNHLFSVQPAIAPNGTLTYTPAKDANGTATVTVYMKDNGGTANGGKDTSLQAQTFTITLTPVNDAPVAYDGNTTEEEDVPVDVYLIASDVDGDALTYTIVDEPENGTVTLLGSVATYTPNLDFFGTDTFTFKVNDGSLDSNTATITITVTPVPDPPKVVAPGPQLEYEIIAGEILTVEAPGLLENIEDPDGGITTFTIISVAWSANGWTTLRQDGSFDHEPNAGFTGSDTLVYVVEDSDGNRSEPITVNFTVLPNAAPVATVGTLNATEDTPEQGQVSGTDDHYLSTELTYAVFSQPANGSVVMNADGSYTYTPDPDFFGTDTFQFTANDGVQDSAPATVTITVAGTQDAPYLMGDADDYTVLTNVQLDVSAANGVLKHAYDPDGDTLSAELVTDVSHGTLNLNPDGSFTYTSHHSYVGTDSFSYIITDGHGNSSDPIEVLIHVVNNAPPVADPLSITTPEDTAVSGQVTGSDPDGLTITFDVVDQPQHGTLNSFDTATGAFTYTPDQDYNGPDSFTFVSNDGTNNSLVATVSITITPVDDAPYFNPGAGPQTSYEVIAGETLNVAAPGLIEGFKDPEGGPFTVGVTTDVTSGILNTTNTGSFTYTSNKDFYGDDTFTYAVIDPTNLSSNPVVVTITVLQNNPPTANSASYTFLEDTLLNKTATGADDHHSATITFSIVTQPTKGTVAMALNGTFTFTPTLDANGLDSFTFRTFDGVHYSEPATINLDITAVDDPPVMSAIPNQNAFEDTLLTFTPEVTDVDSTELVYSLGATAPEGVTIDAVSGEVSWTPTQEQEGLHTFDVCVSDATTQVCRSVTITVTAVNDAPVAEAQSVTTAEDTELEIIPVATDVDSTYLTYQIATQPTNGAAVINAGVITYTPNPDYHGEDSFTFTAFDGELYSAPATITVTVTSVNDAPVLEFVPNEDGVEGVYMSHQVVATDVDGDTLTYSLRNHPEGMTIDPESGFAEFTPSNDTTGAITFDICVTDGEILVCQTVTLSIEAVNDAPVAGDVAQTMDEDIVTDITLDGTDIDNTLEELTFLVVTPPARGMVEINNNIATYTPEQDDNGEVTFTYKVFDGELYSNVATVTLTINPVNDPPWMPEIPLQTGTENVYKEYRITLAYDPDGDELTFYLIDAPEGAYMHPSSGVGHWTPGDHQTGIFEFQVCATDGEYHTCKDVVMDIEEVNDAPVADDISVSTPEDTAVLITLTGTDIENDPLTFHLAGAPAHGNVSIAGSTATYTPAKDYFGTDSFTYVAHDGTEAGEPATVTITITPVNDAPVAWDDYKFGYEDTDLVITLIGTDVDLPGDTLTYSIVSQPTHGTLAQDGNVVTYTPEDDYNGSDNFTFQVNDGALDSNIATIVINLDPVNDKPSFTALGDVIVLEDAGSTPQPGWITSITYGPPDESTQTGIFLIETDNDDLFSVLPYIQPNGTLDFTAADDAFGTANVTVTLVDNGGTANGGIDTSAPYTFVITVLNVNDPPHFHPGPDIIVLEDSGDYSAAWATEINWGTSDNPQELHFEVTANTNPGLFSAGPAVSPTGVLTFRPADDKFGVARVTVVLVDDGGTDNGGEDTSEPQVFYITVTAVNDVPVANPATAETDEDTEVVIPFVATDADNEVLHFEFVTLPTHGTAYFDGMTVVYMPDPDYYGTDYFTYIAKDAVSQSEPARVDITINPVNDRPWSKSESFSTLEDVPLEITLKGGDVETALAELVFTITVQPQNGVLAQIGNAVTYTPNADYNGSDSFSYTVSDGELTSETGVITINITPVNDAPVIESIDQLDAVENEYFSYTVTAADVDGDDLVFSLGADAPAGASIDPETGLFAWTPSDLQNGIFTFDVCVSDGMEISCTVMTIDVEGVNDEPISYNSSFQTREDTPKIIYLEYIDVDGDELTVTIAQPFAHGTLAHIEGNQYLYTPDLDWNGVDTMSFYVEDAISASNTATVTISVSPVEDPPVLADAEIPPLQEGQTDPFTFEVPASDPDIGDTLTYSLGYRYPEGMVIDPVTGIVTWSLPEYFNGRVLFEVCVEDQTGLEACKTYSVYVNPVNDAPVAQDISLDVYLGHSIDIQLLGTDIDGDALTYTLTSGPVIVGSGSLELGTLTLNGDTVTYSTDLSSFYFAPINVEFTYIVSDGVLESAPATVSIRVIPINVYYMPVVFR